MLVYSKVGVYRDKTKWYKPRFPLFRKTFVDNIQNHICLFWHVKNKLVSSANRRMEALYTQFNPYFVLVNSQIVRPYTFDDTIDIQKEMVENQEYDIASHAQELPSVQKYSKNNPYFVLKNISEPSYNLLTTCCIMKLWRQTLFQTLLNV